MVTGSPETISVVAISEDPLVRAYLELEFGEIGDKITCCADAKDAEEILKSNRGTDAVIAVNTPLPRLSPKVAGIEFNQDHQPGDKAVLDGFMKSNVERLPKVTEMTHHFVNKIHRMR